MQRTPRYARPGTIAATFVLLVLALAAGYTAALATPAPGGHLPLSYGGDNTQPYPALEVGAVPPPSGPLAVQLRIAAVPNPFRGSTTIQLTLPAQQAASVEIFDLAGRLIRRLSARASEQPTASVVWDGRNRSGGLARSGVYLVRAATVGQTRTARIVLLR